MPRLPSSDYQRIEAALVVLEGSDGAASVSQVAQRLGMSRSQFEKVFSRWVGVTPKRYLQALTVERAKALLQQSEPVLEVAGQVGLTSGSRLYDHFVTLEGMTPGEFAKGGRDLRFTYGVAESPFGTTFLAWTSRGVSALSFEMPGEECTALEAFAKRWPNAERVSDDDEARVLARRIFSRQDKPERPLSLHVAGTNFQIAVWRALLQLPLDGLSTYGRVATAIERPGSSRAIGQAVGANPVAFLIPCHRVIQSSGRLGGYRWGTCRKQAILNWEEAGLGEKFP